MMFESKQDAWLTGFKDGFMNLLDRYVGNFNTQYEVGFISGMYERLMRKREQL